MKKPNFLLVGASKSGSTTLYHLLKNHPGIFLPDIKEPLYFISEIIKNINKNDKGFKNEGFKDKLVYSNEDYLKLFQKVDNEKAIGEASATYLYYHKHTIPRIKNELGDPKIIIILRDPVNKVFSQYKHLLRLYGENKIFEESLEMEKVRISKNYTAMYHYRAQGMYYEQVKAFKDVFSNVLVILTDELKNNPLKLAKKCYRFLEVNDNFEPKLLNFNISTKRVKSRVLHKALYNKEAHTIKMFFKRIFGSSVYEIYTEKYKNINTEKINVTMKEETRKKLKRYFKEDILKLERLIAKDLSNWKI